MVYDSGEDDGDVDTDGISRGTPGEAAAAAAAAAGEGSVGGEMDDDDDDDTSENVSVSSWDAMDDDVDEDFAVAAVAAAGAVGGHGSVGRASAESSVVSVGSGAGVVARPPVRRDVAFAVHREAVRATMYRTIHVNHVTRMASGAVTGRGMRAYVLSDSAGGSNELAPGQTHPSTLARLVGLTSLTHRDLLVDLGSGDGAAVIGLAAMTGCWAYGVEVVPSRYAVSVSTLARACSALQTARAPCPAHPAAPHADAAEVPDVASAPAVAAAARAADGIAALPPCHLPTATPAHRVAGSVSVAQAVLTATEEGGKSMTSLVAAAASALARNNEDRVLALRASNMKQSVGVPREMMLSAMLQHLATSTVPPPPDPLPCLCSRVSLVCGDMLDVLRAADSPLRRARVVYANNFGNRWGPFQEPVLRLLSRVMPAGAVLVACTRFTRGRRGDGILIDQGDLIKRSSDTLRKPTLFFEVSGGWEGEPLVGDESGALFPRSLLFTSDHDAACEAVWKRGRALPQHAAVEALIATRRDLVPNLIDTEPTAALPKPFRHGRRPTPRQRSGASGRSASAGSRAGSRGGSGGGEEAISVSDSAGDSDYYP